MSKNLPPNPHNPHQIPKKAPKKPSRFGLLQSMSLGLLVLFLISGVYSMIVDQSNPAKEITLSELVQDVQSGNITAITVKGDYLVATYQDTSTKKTQKESGVAVTETLAAYGVTAEKLKTIQINVEGPSGFIFWLAQLTPFLIPLVFLALIIWFLTRQAKGAGMQAFSFGQSKARIILPSDKKQQVLFSDVAGAKEAKEEKSKK